MILLIITAPLVSRLSETMAFHEMWRSTLAKCQPLLKIYFFADSNRSLVGNLQ